MSREIKFRAMVTDKHYFVYGLPYIAFGSGGFFISHSNGWIPSFNDPDSGECTELTKCDIDTLSQFTGLHDKNGKEIYEGDIVEFTWQGKYRGRGIVKYEAFGLHIRVSWCEVYELCLPNKTDREVIGNIYENPELLEKS